MDALGCLIRFEAYSALARSNQPALRGWGYLLRIDVLSRMHPQPEAQDTPLNEVDIQGALRVIKSLEKLDQKSHTLSELLPGNARTTSLARHIHACRQDRVAQFGPDLFAEPAWDIMLTLFVAEKEHFRLKISSVCHESGVALTTALRWIDRLAELGLVQRRENTVDKRSSYLELTKVGLQKMETVLEKMWHSHFPVA